MTETERYVEAMPLSRMRLLDTAYDPDVDATIESVVVTGWAEPPLLDERTGKIIVRQGHVRALRTMRKRSLTAPRGIEDDGADWWVPVTRGWASTDDDEAASYANDAVRLVTAGGWEDDALAEVLGERLDDLAGTGFSEEEAALRVLLGGDEPDPQEAAVHQLVFLYAPDDFTAMYEALGLIRERHGIPSNAEAFVWALTEGRA